MSIAAARSVVEARSRVASSVMMPARRSRSSAPSSGLHGVQFDLASETTHRLGAGGEQGMPLCPFWEIVPDHRQIVGIVEDEQPAGVRLKPLFQGMDHHLLLPGISLGEIEQPCQSHEVRAQGFGGVGLDPQDERIAVTVAIGILHRRLRLANATQAADGWRLGESRRLSSMQEGVYLGEDRLTTGKEGVATERNIPDGHLACAHRGGACYTRWAC